MTKNKYPESAWASRPCRPATLQVNYLEDGCVAYQPEQERVHFLNQTAALVLELCDGRHGLQEIEAQVAAYFDPHEPGQNLTGEILQRFITDGLVTPGEGPPTTTADAL